jgi:hypothetical protein
MTIGGSRLLNHFRKRKKVSPTPINRKNIFGSQLACPLKIVTLGKIMLKPKRV